MSARSGETDADGLGVYVHFPYCLQKCPYCDFLSLPSKRESIPHAQYADAVLAELSARAPDLSSLPLRSVFFGGGTPSLWDTRELGRVLSAILARFPHHREPEITVECNPSSFDARVAAGLRAAGVNRISLGVQSLNAQRLAFLGRLHDADGAFAALGAARAAGFPEVSADLIFGVAGESAAEAAHEVAAIAEAGVTHLSAYALTIEPGTQFGELARRGRLPLLGEDAVAESFRVVEQTLEARGFEHYEISNYARPGSQARHNLGYWRGLPYLGLGTGAWGTIPLGERRVRYRNTPAVERYLAWANEPGPSTLDAPNAFVSAVEELSPEVALSEQLMLGLRLSEGLDWQAAERRTGASMWTPERRRAADKWLGRGALRLESPSRLRLERSHWLLADGILADLI
ncbi:MAG TPA: radical SAM family heme chaperone HemW [Polyangiaceae bacterium]|nr:radical SAM family heme chaperone HemW [Polyangiaceae bacterium]